MLVTLYHNTDVLTLATTSNTDSKHTIPACFHAHRRPQRYKSSPHIFFDSPPHQVECHSLVRKIWTTHVQGTARNLRSPKLFLRNHISATRRPLALWEAPLANSLLWVFDVFWCVSYAPRWWWSYKAAVGTFWWVV